MMFAATPSSRQARIEIGSPRPILFLSILPPGCVDNLVKNVGAGSLSFPPMKFSTMRVPLSWSHVCVRTCQPSATSLTVPHLLLKM